ncbi:hypothetical protein LPJ59_000015 [Coemansia sp. RSA 2399]|nr:hypothetical protein LPJ59_000015 [Coemansia sp. RSA 2399]KAJ1908514.1 hypothetical protein LPJ81_000015 [Coemansia sp. IMI 209127]
MSEDTSPNKLHKLLNKLSITRTPSRSNSLRSRRGVLTIQELELQVNDLNLDDNRPERNSTEEPSDAAADLSSSASKVVYPHQSVQAESVRKRERIAELRRRRLNNFNDLQQQQEHSGNTHGRSPRSLVLSPPTSSHISTAVENGSPIPASARHGNTKSLVSPPTDRFFNSPELNLLLHPIDLESVDEEELAPSERPQSKRQQKTVSPSTNERMDFKIDIPSTSLSPVVTGGLTMLLRRRSRTATTTTTARQGSAGKRRGVSKLFPGAPNTGLVRSQTMTGAMAEAPEREDEAVVLSRIDTERARNVELRKELHQLNSSVNALTRLLVANQAASKDVGSREPYPPLFSD